MVNKLVLQSVINKYYLGEVESVKWKTQDKILTIDFMSINKEVIGNITHTDIDIEDSNLAIFDTKKLLNLVNITSGDLLISLEKTKAIYTKLYFGDEQGHNNKIVYTLTGNIRQADISIPFNSDMFKTILNANKDLEEGILYLSYQGLMKLEFKSLNTTSTYYMIRKEESAF